MIKVYWGLAMVRKDGEQCQEADKWLLADLGLVGVFAVSSFLESHYFPYVDRDIFKLSLGGLMLFSIYLKLSLARCWGHACNPSSLEAEAEGLRVTS